MDANATWQYAVVILLVLFALWKIVKGLKKKNHSKNGGSCCGCALSQTCRDYKKPDETGSKEKRNQHPRNCCK